MVTCVDIVAYDMQLLCPCYTDGLKLNHSLTDRILHYEDQKMH